MCLVPSIVPRAGDTSSSDAGSPAPPTALAPAASTAGSALADPAYFAAFETQRARILRQRIAWSIFVFLFLLFFSVMGTFIEYQEYVDGQKTPLEVVILGGVDDLMLGSMLIATLLYVLKGKPNRRRLVNAITISSIAMMTGATIIEIERSLIQATDFLGNPITGVDARVVASQWALFTHGVFILIPLMLVPMHWRESRRLGFGCWVAYVALITVFATAPLSTILTYAAIALLAMTPPIAFSHWRYQRFDAQFQHNELKGRLGELSAELTQARRLHEALFPAPLETGPVRVRFAYEPMREIGGDFVFMHVAKPTPGASTPPPVFVVLIDVSGHGIASALAVNRLHGELVRMCAAADQSHEPLTADQLIANLNSYVCFTLAPQAMYATALAMRIDLDAAGDAGTLEWASAGHPPAMLRSHLGQEDPTERADTDLEVDGRTVHHLEGTAAMLGVLEPDQFTAGSRRMAIVPGDVVIAYTDGVSEARDENGAELGIARIESIIKRDRGVRPLSGVVVEAAATHRAGHVTDDMLVVEITLSADETRVK